MSWRNAPSALAMNGGSPPTAPNARAGLFTPPGITRLARRKASWLLGSENWGFEVAGVLRVMVFRENSREKLLQSLATDPRGKPSDGPEIKLADPVTVRLKSGLFRAGQAIPPSLSPRELGRITARVCPDRQWHQSQPR